MRYLSNDSEGGGRLRFDPSGRWLYELLGEGLVGWDLPDDSGRPAWTVRRVYGHDLAVSRCGRWLAVVNHDRILAFDRTAGPRPHHLWPEGTHRTVSDATFSPDGEELLAVCRDADGDGGFHPGRVHSWRVGGWDERPLPPGVTSASDRPHQTWLTGRLAVSADGTRLAAEYQVEDGDEIGHGLTVWDRKTGERLADEWISGASVGRLLFTADGMGLLSDQYRSLVRYDAKSLSVAAKFATPAGSHLDELAVCPDGRQVAVGMGEQVVLLDPTSLRPIVVYDFGLGSMVRVAFAPDGLTAAACGSTGRVVVFDLE